MKVSLCGEDGLTLFALTEEDSLNRIMTAVGLKSIDKIWYRPSFGRGLRNGYSGFGESDGMLFGVDKNEKKMVVFLESKRRSADHESIKNQLNYQFFLKLALVNCVMNGPTKEGGYYAVELPSPEEKSKFYESTLYGYYQAYAKRIRTKGWLLKAHSSDSPALCDLEDVVSKNGDNLRFCFLALGFSESKLEGTPEIYFKGLSNPPLQDKVLRGFDFKDGITVPFLNIEVVKVIIKGPIEYENSEESKVQQS